MNSLVQTATVPNQPVLPPGNESGITVNPSTIVGEKDINAMHTMLRSMSAESLAKIIDTIEKTDYDLHELSVKFSGMEVPDNLPICHVPGDKRPYIRVKTNQIEAYPLLDSGAQNTVLSFVHEDELKQYNTQLQPAQMNITTVTKTSSPVAGLLWLEFKMGQEAHVLPTLAIKSHRSAMIVGIDFLEKFNIQYVKDDGPPKKPWSTDKECASLQTGSDEKPTERDSPIQSPSVERYRELASHLRQSIQLLQRIGGVTTQICGFEVNCDQPSNVKSKLDSYIQVYAPKQARSNVNTAHTSLKHVPRSFESHGFAIEPGISQLNGMIGPGEQQTPQ